ncbi:MAG: type II toxin-antitoxin system HicA family toxin [Pseudomonadota bacterium]
MTKIFKLYGWMLADRDASMAFRDFEKLLRAFGFEHVRTTGSHRQYRHPLVPEILSIQPRGNQAKSYQLRQFVDMTETYGLTMGE